MNKNKYYIWLPEKLEKYKSNTASGSSDYSHDWNNFSRYTMDPFVLVFILYFL